VSLSAPHQRRSRRLKDFKLTALLDITKAINNNFSTAELLTIYESIVRDKLQIRRLVLYSHDSDGWKRLLFFGKEDAFSGVDVTTHLLPLREITTLDITGNSGNNLQEIVIPVFHKSSPLAYVLIGDLDEAERGMSSAVKHLPFIQTLTNIMMVAIENKRLAKENLKRAAMHRELELAWEVQRMLFPEHLPNNKYIEMDALYLPHQQVGGDYYDFIQINENELAFCVADVSGKGVPAALLMSNFQAYLRILLQHIPSLSDLVIELNTKVNDNAKGEKFITLFIAKYNTVTRTLQYINAGHNPPLLIDADGYNLLTVGCTGLGMLDELIRVKEGIVSVNPDTLLLCYTDGLVEQRNADQQELGLEPVKELLQKNRKASPNKINALLLELLNKHRDEQSYVDDIALVTCKMI
jgi:sigma-B regulation protein RsbU (phosphoserine phosphatase)